MPIMLSAQLYADLLVLFLASSVTHVRSFFCILLGSPVCPSGSVSLPISAIGKILLSHQNLIFSFLTRHDASCSSFIDSAQAFIITGFCVFETAFMTVSKSLSNSFMVCKSLLFAALMRIVFVVSEFMELAKSFASICTGKTSAGSPPFFSISSAYWTLRGDITFL